MECGKEKEKCEEVTKNLVKITKNLFDVSAKIALRENVFPSRFLLSVYVCSFECLRIAFLSSLGKNEKSKENRRIEDRSWKV